MSFWTKDANTVTITERLRINEYGFIGIGTTAPTHRLDVSGSSRFTGNVTISGSASNSLLVKGSGTTNATNALLVQNANASSSFIVDDAGNVGVGAVNTSYKFNVEGTSRFSSDVTITSPGRLYFTDTTNAYIRASNNRIWLAAFGSEVFVVDSAQNQSISSLRIGSFVNANTSNALTVALAKTAAGGSAASISVSNSLTAAANNDLLIGLDLNPTFSNAGFSNVSNILII